MPNDKKIISLYEPDTRVIVRGKAGAEVEFGNALYLAVQNVLKDGGKCYKMIDEKLVLGTYSPTNGFIADVPEKFLDIKNKTVMSVHYPIINKPKIVQRCFTNESGKVVMFPVVKKDEKQE